MVALPGPVCALLGHRRSHESVRKVDGVYRARCRRCRTMLTKAQREDDWQVEPRAGRPLPVPVSRRGRAIRAAVVVVILVGAIGLGVFAAPRHMKLRMAPGESASALLLDQARGEIVTRTGSPRW